MLFFEDHEPASEYVDSVAMVCRTILFEILWSRDVDRKNLGWRESENVGETEYKIVVLGVRW